MLGFFMYLEEIVWSTPLVCILMFTHIYFTFKLSFPQKYTFRGLKLMFIPDDKRDKGVSSFKSLMTILAGTLGVGNIVGVATAITIGGIGSVFWIFVSGIFAISTKYIETFFVLKYREKKKDGYYGGAMYILRDKLGFKKLGLSFSIFVIFSSFGGSMIQSNAMASSIIQTFNVNKYLLAIIVFVISFYVIFGSEKKIANISCILVPLATFIYMGMCIYLIYVFRNNLINSVYEILLQALNFRSVTGGIFGSTAIIAMNLGLSKGLYSNEAGMGSSPLFNVTVKDTKSVEDESIIASTSVFIDTVIICTITGIVLVASGLYKVTNDPIELIQSAFKSFPYGEYLLSFSLSIFAISTIPCVGYYGSAAIKYIFKHRNFYDIVFKLIYQICVFLGCITAIEIVWSISSVANALMIIPNLLMIYVLSNKKNM